MLSEMSSAVKVIGVKQSKKAIRDGNAKLVLIAADAECRITGPIYELCKQHNVEVKEVPHMKELGSAVGIAVSAAVVTILN